MSQHQADNDQLAFLHLVALLLYQGHLPHTTYHSGKTVLHCQQRICCSITIHHTKHLHHQ
jgi:hypothetical protein